MDIGRSEVGCDPFVLVLEQRVERWLASEEARTLPGAELYRHLPAFYRFLLALALEARLPAPERLCALRTLKYIVAPWDYVPEAVHGTVAYRDDLVLAAMAFEHLAERCPASVLREHWRGAGEPGDVARAVLAASSCLAGVELRERLAEWVLH